MRRKPTTLKDVAEAVGVSINTVSCVLNPRKPGNVKVSPATRAAILKVSRRLGYRRNVAAARLVGCQTRTLGILMSNLLDPMAAVVVDAFEEQAVEMGYQCFIGCTRFRGLRKLDYVEQFLSHGVDGLLLTTIWNDPEVENALRMALDTDMPTVFIDYMWEERPAPLICGNHFKGGQLLARHLLSVGHRKLAFLCDDGQRKLRSIEQRVLGIRDEISSSRESHLDLVWSPSHRAVDFARVVYERLQMPNPPTAILCSGDLTAIELMGGLTQYGIEVPRDLCITGFDDLLTPYIQANLHMDPGLVPWRFPLTTIRQPMGKIGKTAAEVLIQQIESGKKSKGEEHLLDVELVVGATSIPSKPILAGKGAA